MGMAVIMVNGPWPFESTCVPQPQEAGHTDSVWKDRQRMKSGDNSSSWAFKIYYSQLSLSQTPRDHTFWFEVKVRNIYKFKQILPLIALTKAIVWVISVWDNKIQLYELPDNVICVSVTFWCIIWEMNAAHPFPNLLSAKSWKWREKKHH